MGRGDVTAGGDPEDASDVDPGAGWIAGRYRLEGLLGRGACGQVFAARDRRTDQRVAVKLVSPHRAHLGRQVRRELVALRLLRLPGVVRLLDDGEDRGQTFLVTELLPGGPFRGPGGWDRWGDRVVALLRSLARVHLAGVVHCDLKPTNVLLDERGLPVITDFGLARGRRIDGPVAGWIEGTPRYMAPEQRRGEPCDARADLYAVGVMMSAVTDGAPPEVTALMRALSAEAPADRPRSAWEALEAIGVRRPDPLPVGLPEPASVDDVARQVLGEPAVAFVRTERDAAEILVARTGGRHDRLRAELESWVRSGVCADVEGGVRVDPVAIRQLQLVDDDGYRRVVSAASPADEALRVLDRRIADGALESAFAMLEAVLPAARDRRETHLGVVRAMARVAMDLDVAAALDHAVAAAEDVGEQQICAMLRAFSAARALDRARVLELVPRAPFSDEELEIHRVGTIALAVDGPTAYLADIEAWAARSPRRRAKWLGWRGNAAYREGAYAEAADHHERSAAAKTLPHERVSSLSNAAAAHLELGAFDHAVALAERAAGEATCHSLAAFAARASVLARIARYRSGQAWDADRAFVAAATPFGAHLLGVAALTEASAGWRTGHPDASALAEMASTGFRAAGSARLQLLADALRIALDPRATDPGPPLAYAATAPADDCGARTALQILGLVAPAVDVDRDLVTRLAAALPPERRDVRLDVLSVREVLERVATRR